MNLKTCRCCEDRVHDITMRFDANLGVVCPECHENLVIAHQAMTDSGVAFACEHHEEFPHTFRAKPENP